jgi:hypothetical protein
MGKGIIVSGGTDGLYQIDYEVDKTRIQAKIDALVNAIVVLTEVDIPAAEAEAATKQTTHTTLLVQLNSAINLGNDTTEITRSLSIALSELNAATNRLNSSKMKLGSLTQEKKFLTDNLPPDEEISAWCADLNESLSGEVGTIEVPGERTAPVIIRPGGESGNDAVYNAAADGQIVPVLGLSPSENFYNLAIMTGWQKYQPTYRLGEITNLNANLCDITLDAAVSSLQGLDVNPTTTLTNVPITYLTCDGAAFEVGDRVVIKYTGSGPGTPYTPSVIGFEKNPKGCGCPFTADILSGSAPLIVQFTETSTGSPTNWLWDFGDGFQSNEQNPVHIYTDAGSYSVTLTTFTSSSVTVNGFTDAFENRKSGAGHGSNAAAWAAFNAASWIPFIGTSIGRYHVQQGSSADFQYNATRVTIENINLTSYSAPKIAVLELLYQNVGLTEGTVLLGTGEKAAPGDNAWEFVADITSSLGTIFTTTISDLSFPLLTSPGLGGKNGWQISDARAIVHTPTFPVDTCTSSNYITVT